MKKNHKAMSHIHKKNKNNNKNKEKNKYENRYSESDRTIINCFDSKKILNFKIKIQKNEKNLFNQEEPLMSNVIRNELNINIEMHNDKDLKNKIGDKEEIYELSKNKYFKNKEKMMLMNKRNIKA